MTALIAGQGHPDHGTLHTHLRDARDAIAHGDFAYMGRFNRIAKVHSPLGHGTGKGQHPASDLRDLTEIAAERRPTATVININPERLWVPPCDLAD